MLFYAVTSLINAIASTILGLFVFFKNTKAKINQIFALFCLSIAIWAYSYYFWQMANNAESALFWSRALMAGSIFIPAFYFHFILSFLGKINQKKKFILISYLIFVLFFISNFTSLFVKEVSPALFFEFWPKPGILFHPFIVIWLFFVVYCTYLLITGYKESSGIKKGQIKYILLGITIGFIGGGTNYFLWYDIPIPPFGNPLVVFFVLATTYGILKYRLMDIKVMLGKTAIYIFSFAIVIGIGLGFSYLNLYFNILPIHISNSLILIISILLFEPSFRFFEKIASRYFYYSFYSYQQVLTELGEKLTQLLDLDDLASVITNTLLKTMKLERIVILLRDQRTGNYKIKKNIGFREENGISLVKDNFLTKFLEENKKPLVYEELSLIIKDTKNEKEKEKFEKLKNNMKRIEARLCLPLLIEGKIIGLIVMGNKLSGESYSIQDLELLTGLANQSSIALQNAKLYSEVQELSKNLERRVKEQVKQIEELSEMKSEFLKVVNHQLRTPVSIIKGMASMLAEGSLKGEKRDEFIKKIYLSSERLETILDDILLAQSLAGRSEPVKFSPCQIEEVVEKQFEHLKTQAEMKNLKMVFIKPEDKLPVILADSEMLQKAISRLIDNAILYTNKGEIKISADLRKEGEKDFIEISVQDSGLGLEKDDQKNLFKLFYRGEKAILMHPNGSGLGLFIVKEIINSHQGRVEVQSDGIGKGATFKIILPIITEV